MEIPLPPPASSPRGVRRVLIETNRFAEALRRRSLVARSRLGARRVAAGLHLDVHPSVLVGHHVVIETWHDTRNVVVIGEGVRLGDHTWISMRGGRLTIGSGTDVRRGVTINSSGTLTVGSEVVLSTGTHLHCADRVKIGDHTIVGEFTTIVDSQHRRGDPGQPIHHTLDTSEVVIGRNVWVGAKATVAAGVHVGDDVTVAGSAVVVTDVDAGVTVAGIPARPVRALDD